MGATHPGGLLSAWAELERAVADLVRNPRPERLT
jgi:hypothetical protein